MANELYDPNASQVPDWMSGYQDDVKDDVTPNTGMSVYRVSQGLSDVVQEEGMPVGHFYEINERQSLGTERRVLIFRKRKIRQKNGPQNKFVACKSYDLNQGFIRLYNKDQMPDDFLNEKGWNVPQDVLDNEDERLAPFSCKVCPFAEGKEVLDPETNKKKWIPPSCQFVHEIYFVDITDLPKTGELDMVPHRLDIVERSAVNRQINNDLDRAIATKLFMQRLPIFAGVFKLHVVRAENKEGTKYPVPRFDFEGIIPANMKDAFDLAAFLRDRQAESEANAVNNDRDANDTAHASEGRSDSGSNVQAQSGNPWGAKTEASEPAERPAGEAANPWGGGAATQDPPSNDTPW